MLAVAQVLSEARIQGWSVVAGSRRLAVGGRWLVVVGGGWW